MRSLGLCLILAACAQGEAISDGGSGGIGGHSGTGGTSGFNGSGGSGGMQPRPDASTIDAAPMPIDAPSQMIDAPPMQIDAPPQLTACGGIPVTLLDRKSVV